ncbi:MAG: NAD-dependent epimerase/dehydratase family protein [Pseudomonadota bacterium]
MRPQRSLVLGANGFIGTTLCKTLHKNGETFRAFDCRPPRAEIDIDGLDWFEGNFFNEDQLLQALIGCDAVYHLISTTIPATSNRDPMADCKANVLGSLKLLELAQQVGIRKIVFVSSGGTVYGIPKSIPIPETAPTDPLCAYGISKLSIEKYLYLYHFIHGLEYCVLRVSNPYGVYQAMDGDQGVVGVFLGKALSGRPIDVWGDGVVVRDYIFANDVVAAMLKAMHYKGKYRIFNVGSGEGRSLKQVLATIEHVLETVVEVQYSSERAYDVPVSVLDISRATTYLGWQPKVSFEEGVKQVADYYMNRVEGKKSD